MDTKQKEELTKIITDIIQLHFYELKHITTKQEVLHVELKIPEGWINEINTITDAIFITDLKVKAEFIDNLVNQCFEIGMITMLQKRYPEKPPTWNSLIEKIKKLESEKQNDS